MLTGIYKRGFTLVELLVVISIIGVLVSIIIPNLNGAKQSSRDAKRISDIKNIQLGLALYYSDYGFYPFNINNTFDSSNGVTASADGLVGAYMSIIPKDPKDNSLYVYAPVNAGATTNCTGSNYPISYHMGAILEFSSNTDAGSLSPGSGDVDKSVPNTNSCNPLIPSGNFDGHTTGCTGASLTPTENCYDVVPN